MENHLQELEKIENEVAVVIRANHARELGGIDAALNQILAGFEEFRSRKGRADDRKEGAWLFLTTRSFNSLRIARQSLNHGYYQQAISLTRMVMEDQLIAEVIEEHCFVLAALLDGRPELGKGKLRFTEIANLLPREGRDLWVNDHGLASSYAAHPRLKSMQLLTLPSQGNGRLLGMGSFFYEKEVVNMVLYFMLDQLVKVMATLRKVTDSVWSEWSTDSKPAFEEVLFLREQILDWKDSQRREPIE